MSDTNKDKLLAKIKNLLGSAANALNDDLIGYAIDDAVTELGRIKPKIEYVVIQTVTGVSRYALPTDVSNVLEVVFPELDGDGDYGFPSNATLGDGDISTFHSHSLAVITAQKWEQFMSRYGNDWEFDMDTNELLVIPTPKVNGKIAAKLSMKRDIENVPESLLWAVQDLALAESFSMASNSLGSGISSIPIGIGTVTFDTRNLSNQANVLRTNVLKKLGRSTGGGEVVIG